MQGERLGKGENIFQCQLKLMADAVLGPFTTLSYIITKVFFPLPQQAAFNKKPGEAKREFACSRSVKTSDAAKRD